MVGGMHGRGACMTEGMCGGGHAWQRGHAWQGGMCGMGIRGYVQERWPQKREVRILLECILVCKSL